MDALALLCNLYGDGPATLKRLRSAGCASFGALEDLEADQLAEILGIPQAAARRFLREARLLVERVAEGELEIEERPPLGTAPSGPPAALPRREPRVAEQPAVAAPESARATAPTERRPEPATETRSDGADNADVEDRSTELIDRVLATWRERDAALAERASEATFGEGLLDEAPAEAEARDAAPAEGSLPGDEAHEPTPGTPLRARLVDGLDRGMVDRLRASGLKTLEAVADGDALEIARSSSTELTKIMRLQFLARRQVSRRDEGAGSEAVEVLQPAGRPWPLAKSSLPRPAPAAPASVTQEPSGPKFSVSETPFGVASSGLADELDRASRRLRRSDAEPGPREGTGGPFA